MPGSDFRSEVRALIAEILAGLAAILDWQVLGFLAVGVSLGAVFGSLPGLTATMGVAVLTPLTFWVSAEQGLAMLLGIYCGAIPAGGIPAILINVPGTPASIATTWDGYALTRKGSAGLALGVNAIASAVGQLTSIMFLAFLAFPIARFALQFGPAEYFGLALLGISLMAGVSGRHVIKGMLAGMLGLALALVGLDPMTAYPRYTFGMSEFLDGISFVPVMIGLFGLGEVLIQISERHKARKSASAEIGRILPSAPEARTMAGATFSGATVGTMVGAIPAAGGDIGSVIAWEQARRASKDKDSFGKGSLRGLAASCSACNAAIGGAMTTMLTLGIPGDAVSAILIGALLIHGIQPGPLLFAGNQSFVFSIVFLLVFASLLIMAVGLLGARPLARILNIPPPWLWTGIVLFGTVGAYALNNATVDVWAMYAAGLAGFLFRKARIPLGPLVLGLILGPMMESNLRRALILSRGDWLGLLTRPILLVFLAATVLSLLWPLIRRKLASTNPQP
ncbi:MAG: tripartite tricarboxylate transporter permease [Bryobacterales bacterium]|nr:tripartite tricarboxylate transporter permease [Bryobacterales bacterium]MDE0628759.1 tripartite tricarboxylate transporter permease [Bryobacterales bacterium]